jgi:hypothetical protein
VSFWDNVVPESREWVRARYAARHRGDAVPARLELKILTKSGEERCLDFTDGLFEFGGKLSVVGIARNPRHRKSHPLRDPQRPGVARHVKSALA